MNHKFQIFGFTIVLLVSSLMVKAQSFSFTSITELKKGSDFRKQEYNVLKMIDWLMSSESFSSEKRDETIQYVNSYADKHPYIKYNPSKSLNKFKKSSEYGLQFKLGWIRYVLTYEYSTYGFENHKKALKHTLNFYEKNKVKYGRNSYLEKLKKVKGNIELESYIETKI